MWVEIVFSGTPSLLDQLKGSIVPPATLIIIGSFYASKPYKYPGRTIELEQFSLFFET